MNESVTPNTTTRRDFIKKAGIAAASTAALSALPALSEDAPKQTVVALVGAAHIHAPNYARILKDRPDVKVKCVWDHDHARAEKYAAQLGCPVVEDLKKIWSDPSIKAVVICSETNLHRELILAAAEAKRHMFAEKPLGFTSEDSQAMAAAIEKAGVLFTTGYFMRTDPAILYLKQQVEKESFGKISRVRASNCHSGSLQHWFDGDYRWMADPKIAGVGAFGDLGTHKLDILMWLFGDVSAITADIKPVLGNYGDCDETGEALIKFKNGIIGTLAAGWVDMMDPVTLMITGTDGFAYIDNNRLIFTSTRVPGAERPSIWTDLPQPPPSPMDQFLDAVGGKPNMPLVTPKEAAARVSVMEAAYKGAKEQAWANPA